MEDPWIAAPEYVYSRTKSLEEASQNSEKIVISFEKGDVVAVNHKKLKPHEILTTLNVIAM